jgi:hypothetical protein
MTWYYALGNDRQGPVDDATLDRLIATGVVTNDTLVWRAGMADWQPLSRARPQAPPPAAPPPPAPLPPVAVIPTPAPTPTPMTPVVDPSTQPRFGTPSGFGAPSGFPGGGSVPPPGGGYGQMPPAGGSGGGGGYESPDECYARVMSSGRSLAIGDIIGRAWQLVTGNFGLAVGTAAVVLIILAIAGAIPCIGAIISLIVRPVLIGGLYLFFLKLNRRQPAEFGDAFSGFSIAFLPLFLQGLVQAVLTLIALAPGIVLFVIGSNLADRSASEAAGFGLMGLGFLVMLPVAIYLSIAWAFSPMLIIDKGYDFWPAMELSRKVATKHGLSVFGLMFLCGLIMVAGVLALCLGVFVAFPVVFAAMAIAYDDLFA